MSNRFTRHENHRILDALKRTRPYLLKALKYSFFIVFFAVIAAFLLYKAALFVQQLPHFQLTQIEISPTRYLEKEQILQAIGLDKESNYFQFDTQSATQSLLSFPWITSARITTELPNKMVISITEREAAGILVSESLYLVDSLGVPFAHPSVNQAPKLPLITGLSNADLENDSNYSRERIMNALALARMYERTNLAKTRPLSDIALTAGDQYDLHLGKTRVSLGKGNFAIKLARTEAILNALKDRNLDAEYILLSENHPRAIVKEKPLSNRNFDAFSQER